MACTGGSLFENNIGGGEQPGGLQLIFIAPAASGCAPRIRAEYSAGAVRQMDLSKCIIAVASG